jgi:hypothetical protein
LLQAGKVPATRNERDQWLIKPAELHRIYPPAAPGSRKVKGQSEFAEANRRAALWTELKASLLHYALALLTLKKHGCTTTMLKAQRIHHADLRHPCPPQRLGPALDDVEALIGSPDRLDHHARRH